MENNVQRKVSEVLTPRIPTPPTPYYDERAEKAVLGSILENPESIPSVMEVLNQQSFYLTSHQILFETILQVYAEHDTVDCLLVNHKLTEKGLMNRIGGDYVVPDLMGTNVITPEHVLFYAEIVRDRAYRRQVKFVGNQITELSNNLDIEGTDELSSSIEQLVSTITARHRKGATIVGNIAQDILDEIENRKEKRMLYSTGLVDLDRLTAGLQMGELFIIAGRPSQGKCVAWDSLLMNPDTGEHLTIKDVVSNRNQRAICINDDLKLETTSPDRFIYSGIQRVFRVTTRSGKAIKVTQEHPFLTFYGWRQLAELDVGAKIATPRILPYFGDKQMDESEVKILAYLIGDGGLTQSTPMFTNSNQRLVEDISNAIFDMPRSQLLLFGSDMRVTCHNSDKNAPSYSFSNKRNNTNPVTELCKEHGIWGKLATEKGIPTAIFGLPKEQVALFLNRLYACDGSAYINKGGNSPVIEYTSSSKLLALQVHHLLLRFGIVGKLYPRKVKYNQEYRDTYKILITGKETILLFAKEIGIYGKEDALHSVCCIATKKRFGYSWDTIPGEVREAIFEAKHNSKKTWVELGKQMGRKRHKDAVPKKKQGYRRETVKLYADYFDDKTLSRFADSDVFWDEIISIDDVGDEEVYDLSTQSGNFVANDIIVHNTTLAAQIATYQACTKGNPVLFCTYEMSDKAIVMRMLSRTTEISFQKLSAEVLDESEKEKLSGTVSQLVGCPLYITDTQYNIQQLKAHVKHMKAKHDIVAVFVDYITVIPADRRYTNQVEKITEYSVQLKAIASENNICVVALSQLSRASERRAGGRPMLSDLRDSGSIEQSADVVLFVNRPGFYDDDDKSNMAMLYLDKQRNGPRGEITMKFDGKRFQLEEMYL